jgi:hypothetical protein
MEGNCKLVIGDLQFVILNQKVDQLPGADLSQIDGTQDTALGTYNSAIVSVLEALGLAGGRKISVF